MKIIVLKLALTFLLGLALTYVLGGFFLAIVYAILWIDKIIIGSAGNTLRHFGIEFTTFATLILASALNPFIAFAFALIAITLLNIVKFTVLPIQSPDWPFFIPSPYDVIDAIGTLIAGFLIGLELLYLVIIIIIIKDILYALAEKYIRGKPINFISAFFYLIFNILLIYQLGWVIELII